jgi:starch phosphorylase
VRVWVTDRYGNVPLYLLEPTKREDRWITHRLYESGTDTRIAQEQLLGIGGARALGWLGWTCASTTSTRATPCSPGSSASPS